MQEQDENFEGTDFMNKSVEDLFLGIQETYDEAQQRAAEESKSFARTEYFRMDKLGTYNLRILPIAPNKDGSADRKSYEYPVHQLLLEIEKPNNGGKPSFAYVTVPRATDAGYSVDIIDIYRKAAVNEAKENGEDKLAEKIGGGSFGGGLKYTYGHAMFVFDLHERAKGMQLLTLSHAQFKDLDERKFKLWQKKLAKNSHAACPISSVYNAYPVEIEKKKNGSKTEYIISIDNEADVDPLSKEELTALLSGPRIPEIIYRYTRYQFEATLVFLKQADEKYGLSVMETEEMKEAIEQLRSELPKDDTSTFTFDKRSKDSKENAENTSISLDDLLDRLDELSGKSLGDKTEEGQELRTLIRSYIEQEKLPVRVTRSTTNSELLDQIEKILQGDPDEENGSLEESTNAAEEPSEEEPPKTTRTRNRR